MKKLITSLFALILVLAGCGSDTEVTDTESGELSGSIQVAVDPGYVPYIEEMATGFTEETGVTVDVVEAEMFDVLEALPTQQGNSADIFLVPGAGDLVEQKLITPIETDISNYTETAQEAATNGDSQYFLPLTVETTLFIYNQDLMSEAPDTLAELDPSEWASDFTGFYTAAGAFISEGGYIFGENNTDSSDIGLNNEGSIAAAEFIQSLYTSGDQTWDLMRDNTVAYDIMTQAFLDGSVKAIIDGPWALQGFTDAGINYAVAPIPSLTGTGDYAPLVGTKGLAINAYSDNIAACQAFLEYLNTTERAERFSELTNEVNPNTGITYEEGSVQEAIQAAAEVGTPKLADPAFEKVWDPMNEALKQIAAGADVKEALDAAVVDFANDIASIQ